MNCTLSLAVTSELPFSQRKEREDPEHEQVKLMEPVNSTSSVTFGFTNTLDTGTVRGKKNESLRAKLQTEFITKTWM